MNVKQYSKGLSLLHWLVALMFTASYVISDGMPRYFDQHLENIDVSGQWVANFHVYAGIAFVAVVLIRFIVRLTTQKPEQLESASPLLNKVATGTHHALYLLMFLVPIAGVIGWYEKITIFGDIHVLLMNLMLGLVGLHIAAAIYHQWVLKDGILSRISLLKSEKRN
jgi:cytochrome b561